MTTATNTQLGEIILAGDLAGNGGPQVGTNPQLKTMPGLVAGSYSLPNITVDSKGRVTNIQNGGADLSSLLPVATRTNAGIVKLGEHIHTTGVDVPGFWLVDFGGTLSEATSTGLSNQSCAQYSLDIIVDQFPKQTISVRGSDCQTISTLIAKLNESLEQATVTLRNGNIAFVSNSLGNVSKVQLLNVSLFSCVTGYISLGAATDGVGSCEIFVKRGSSLDYGVVKIGDGIEVSNGVISVDASAYPLATETELGGVSVPTSGGLVVSPLGALSIQPATTSSTGAVKVGSGLNVAADGKVSVDVSNLPLTKATASVSGAVKVGAGLNVTGDGTLSIDTSNVSLPAATNIKSGAVKVGAGLSVDVNGELSINPETVTLPIATSSTVGAVKVGPGLKMAPGGALEVDASSIQLAAATTSTVGAVKVGSGLKVDGVGKLEVDLLSVTLPKASATVSGAIKIGSGLNITMAGALGMETATTVRPGAITVGEGLNARFGGTYGENGWSKSILEITPATTGGSYGAIKIGTGFLPTADGTLNVPSVPNATTSVHGLVKLPVDGALMVNGSGELDAKLATNSVPGMVRISYSGGLSVDETGKLSITQASETVYGAVKVGSGLNIAADGKLSVVSPQPPPIVDVATKTTNGVVRIGPNIDVDASGVISIPFATNDVPGIVKIAKFDGGLNISNGVVSLKPAGNDEYGGVKVPTSSNGLKVDTAGRLSIDETKIANPTNPVEFTNCVSHQIKAITMSGAEVDVPVKTGNIFKVDASGTVASTLNIRLTGTTPIDGQHLTLLIKTSATTTNITTPFASPILGSVPTYSNTTIIYDGIRVDGAWLMSISSVGA